MGLQCIAEIGDWVVFRENKPKCQPFYWHQLTGNKQWEAPPSLAHMGIAEHLKKWSEELPDRGIMPGPHVNPEGWGGRGARRRPPPPPPMTWEEAKRLGPV